MVEQVSNDDDVNKYLNHKTDIKESLNYDHKVLSINQIKSAVTYPSSDEIEPDLKSSLGSTQSEAVQYPEMGKGHKKETDNKNCPTHFLMPSSSHYKVDKFNPRKGLEETETSGLLGSREKFVNNDEEESNDDDLKCKT